MVPAAKADLQGDFWVGNIPLDFLKRDTEYELQVQAQNSLGYGAMARSHKVYNSNGKAASTGTCKNKAIL